MTSPVKPRGPLLDHLDEIEARCSEGELTLKMIFSIFGNEGHYVLIFFLILPFLQPIPMLGLSTPIGILIGLVAYFAYLKRPPVIPKRWENKTLPASTVLKIAESSEFVFAKVSFMIRPRWKFFFSGSYRKINALLIILNAALLSLPLPIPFSNAVPAWMVLFQALGHLKEDGFFILLSYVQTILCLVFFGLLGIGFISGMDNLLETKNFWQ
jgi:hypothetical protein